MKYYFIKRDSSLQDTPVLSKVFQKYPMKNLTPFTFKTLPKKILMRNNYSEHIIYPGVFVEPLPLFKKEIWEIVHLYEPDLDFIQIDFYDEYKKKTFPFVLPCIPRLKFLSPSTTYNINKSIASNITLKEIPSNKHLFYLGEVSNDQLMISQDLLESILIRDFTGLSIHPTQIEQ